MLLEQKIAQLLIQKNKTLAVAESCTGGLLANRLTNISGSSDYLEGGFIVYSNASKIKLLKISPAAIKNNGAVSDVVAQAMAASVRKILKTNFGVAITGIAGPTGGSKTKPVGLTFIAVATSQQILCKKFIFKGSRLQIKSQAATQALQLLLSLV